MGRKKMKALPGHQDCPVCHPPVKAGKTRERFHAARAALVEAATAFVCGEITSTRLEEANDEWQEAQLEAFK